MMADSPRKKLKRENNSLPPQRIPESPSSEQSDVRSRDLGRAMPSSPNSSVSREPNTDCIIYDPSTQSLAGASGHPPSKPNMSIRKAGFPSQVSHIQRQNHNLQASNSSTVGQSTDQSSQQHMRRQLNAYQYETPNNLQYPGHNLHSLHASNGTSYHNGTAQTPMQNPYFGPSQTGAQIMRQGPNPTSIANQYAASGRPRPRLVQRSDTHSQEQGNNLPGGFPNNPHQGYRPGPVSYQSSGNQYSQGPLSASAINRLSEVFPHLPDAILRKALIQARGDLQDAQALIADNRVKFDMADAYSSAPQSNGTAAMYNNGYPQSGYGTTYYPSRALPASTKREIKAPNLSIREKQALRTAQTYTGHHQVPQQQFRYDNPYGSSHDQIYHLQNQQRHLQMQQQRQHEAPPVYEAPKLRTRAVRKGPKIDIASDESEEEAAIDLESEEDDNPSGTDSENEQISDREAVPYLDFDRIALESRVLHFFNTVNTSNEIADLASCSEETASHILNKRPYSSLDEIQVLDQIANGKRPSRARKTTGSKAVEMAMMAMEGYEAIDALVEKCEEYGRVVKESIARWGVEIANTDTQNGAIAITKVDAPVTTSVASDVEYLSGQPSLLPDGVRLKDYQLFGVNWLHLMYQKKLSGILADEMGLGKTCQVISFLGILLERNLAGPHLIVVPASTLENWLREISRFCPSLKVEAYYGSQRERNEFRDQFEGEKRDFNVMVTTYQLATGAKDDRSFLRRQHFDVCVYDEGHNLKNSSSSRYKYLMALKANFRVLLTGTPLQNNLKELISLLAFVLPKVFAGNIDRLDEIFKIKSFGDTDSLELALLSQERIKRAKTMMTPFILRRFKKDVLGDLPEKKYRVDYLELNEAQKAIYNENLAASKTTLDLKADGKELLAKDVKSAVNVMMQLRKCSNHPMLFRRQYTDTILKKMAKAILKEETFRDSQEQFVIEDMEVMTDFELNRLCLRYSTIARYALDQDCWMEACKVQHLQKILPEMKRNGDRVLLFSQFTQTLDILEDCMDTMGITYFRLDGSTNVSARQDLIDQFHEEPDITVFLLSTKAGGFGINLACANVVIIYDSSFNPHDDKQAEDRAHRVGQKREVQIIRLVTKNTIEEHIARLANTKLTLDSSISGDPEAENKALEEQGEKRVAQSLISQLKEQ